MNNYNIVIIALILLSLSIMPILFYLTGSPGISGFITAEEDYEEVASTNLSTYFLRINGVSEVSIEITTSLKSTFIVTNEDGCKNSTVDWSYPVFDRLDHTNKFYFEPNEKLEGEKICFIINKEANGMNKISYRPINE